MAPNIPSPGPVEINSVPEWNKYLREAKPQNRAVVVDFHATWCGPCKQIAPMFTSLSVKHYQHADFLRVDVDAQKAIAKKYQISAMPTFIVIRNGEALDTLKGADPRGLTSLIEKHAIGPQLPPEAELAKSKGNKAFADKKWAKAAEHYGEAIQIAPKSSVLYANRTLAYIKQIQDPSTPLEERLALRPKAMKDAITIPVYDERWAKGWVRMSEALVLMYDEEALASKTEEEKAAERKKGIEGATEALETAIILAAGLPQVKAEAEKRLAELKSKSAVP